MALNCEKYLSYLTLSTLVIISCIFTLYLSALAMNYLSIYFKPCSKFININICDNRDDIFIYS